MEMTLHNPGRVCMPPPLNIDYLFFHCKAKMNLIFQTTKFFEKNFKKQGNN